jgi:hypothetical protein
MDKIASFLFGTGWWSVWYTVLLGRGCAQPGADGVAFAGTALTGQHPGTISTLQAWAIVLHPLIIPASATLFTLSRTTPGVMKYFQGAGLAALLWFVGLWLIFAAWWSIDGLNTPRRERTLNILLMLAVSAILHSFNLCATWKFRAR